MGLLDVVTIASVVPVLSLFTSNDIVIQKFSLIISSIGFSNYWDPKIFSIFFVLTSALIFLITTIFRIFTILQINRFVEGVRHNLSFRILDKYLNKSYAELLSKDTSEIAKVLLSEVDQFIVYVFRPAVLLISGVIVFILIFGFLIYSSPIGSLISVSFIIIFYFCFFLLVKKPLANFGNLSSTANELRFKFATEAFRAFKDIKIYNSEDFFTNRFKVPSRKFAKALSSYSTLEVSPKYLLEFIAFSGLMLVTIIMIINAESSTNSLGQLPIIGTFAFGAYKSQPILSSIFHGLGSLKFGERIIKNIFKELKFEAEKVQEINVTKYCNQNSIEFKNVSYSYYQNDKKITLFNDLSLKFKNKGLLILTGSSGIGKSTMLDLILGLIKPSKGKIYFYSKNKKFHKKIKISYLHQNFNLYNSDVISNVAFGLNQDEIDLRKVSKVLNDVQMLSFINKLPDKLKTIIGENGKNLSGGQKQRIAIARAIYFNPDILILDEPTSALDNKVENKIFEIIKEISKDRLVIMSTHNLSKKFENDSFLKINDANNVYFSNYQEIIS
tara:strand:- start:14327 stop:15994 length:1668 start_codon:yes stop_codon:yes gene_type:complete